MSRFFIINTSHIAFIMKKYLQKEYSAIFKFNEFMLMKGLKIIYLGLILYKHVKETSVNINLNKKIEKTKLQKKLITAEICHNKIKNLKL